jgi:hypothetical protein
MVRISNLVIILVLAVSCDSGDSGAEAAGQGGSMARFAISGDHMYVVTSQNLSVYGIAAGNFSHISDTYLESGLETITTRNEYLYIGSREAMYIYSIADAGHPVFLFRYAHIRSCDPVVVQGNRAYVTLRAGNPCGGGQNVLEIIDITNPKQPFEITTFQMTSPGGLGINGNCLFVCEGAAGLRMMNVTGDEVEVIGGIDDINAYDVIVQSSVITVTGEDGVFQYNYDCSTASMDLISKIPVIRAEQ